MATVTEALLQLLCTRQRDKEDVLEYIQEIQTGLADHEIPHGG